MDLEGELGEDLGLQPFAEDYKETEGEWKGDGLREGGR